MPNRLASESSPYLRQHASNPVDWYPWGDEAFAKAKAENKPIFLSIGYSSCHWCHVMESESFENPMVAEILNTGFVSVKVDREEHPDVDEAYMAFVQLVSGRGGWPLSLFLTPDRQPFFGGTYFPLEDRGKYLGFMSLLVQVGGAWQMQTAELLKSADEYGKALAETLSQSNPGTFAQFDRAFAEQATRNVLAGLDTNHGGFGEAPKFPPHSALELLLDVAVDERFDEELRRGAIGAALFTLQHMAAGGIHDQVGGGFHRYSTDERWLLPHFEKMLYDNALLLKTFASAAGLVGEADPNLSRLLGSVAGRIAAWTTREMMAPSGWFYSSLDADSDGEEGKFYVWKTEEIRSIVGAEAEGFLAEYGCEDDGNFQDEASGQKTGSNVLHREPGTVGTPEVLERLLRAREERTRPALDDKGLISWNGLMIGAMASAGLLAIAERAALAVLQAEARHGQLPHYLFGDGEGNGVAFLDDYAALADALFQVAEARAEAEIGRDILERQGYQVPKGPSPDFWLDHAERLTSDMIETFWDAEHGAFFSSSDRHESLFGRTKPVFDQPIPSGNALALRCLLNVGDEVRARILVEALLGWIERAPGATEALLAAALPLLVDREVSEPVSPVKRPSEVVVEFEGREVKVDPSGKGRVVVRLNVPEGTHVNSNSPPARWLIPTAVKVAPLQAVVTYPKDQDIWSGEVEIVAEVQLPTGQRDAEFEVRVAYQACTETECHEAQERVFSGVLLR